jgi:hypothetical protein
MNSATTCRVVCLPNVVYEPRNGTTHPAKLAGQLAVRSTEEAIYAFSREDSVSDRGTTGHW